MQRKLFFLSACLTALSTCKNTKHVICQCNIQSPVIELFKYSNVECLFSTDRGGSTPVSIVLYTEIVRFFRMTQGPKKGDFKE